MSDLALFGGTPVLTEASPHYVWPRITPAVEAAVVRQMHETVSIYDGSGIFQLFEDTFRNSIGREHALVTNSGTSALHSVYEGLGLGPGDEVIVPAYTFFATAAPLAQLGVNLRQVDADPSGNIDPALIAAQVAAKTKAIVITHMWGIPCDLGPIRKFATEKGLALIEDCSHAHGALHENRPVGALGDAAIWSLQGQKGVTGGEGGILLTDNTQLFERAVLLGQYNKRARRSVAPDSPNFPFTTTGFGLKLRAHPLAIAMAHEQLGHLNEWRAIKHEHACLFAKALAPYPFLRLPDIHRGSPSWYAFVFTYDEKCAGVPIACFYGALQAEGLREVDRPGSTGCLATYPLFTNTEAALPRFYSEPMLINRGQPMPVAERIYASAIKLPVWAFADERKWVDAYCEGLVKVCDTILKTPERFLRARPASL